MHDTNFIKSQLESWRSCINWIEYTYPERLFELEHELENFRAITYEEKLGSSGINESMRRSIVNDKINELESYKKHCESVIEFCEKLMGRVKPQYRDVFEYRYKTQATWSWISYKTGYSASGFFKILDVETERLANE